MPDSLVAQTTQWANAKWLGTVRAGQQIVGETMGKDLKLELQKSMGQVLSCVATARGDLLSLKDDLGRYLFVNEPMATFMQRAESDILGQTDADVFDPDLVRLLRSAEQTALSQAQPLSSEHTFEWRGQRHEFSVHRAWLNDVPVGQQFLCSVWTNTQPELHRATQLRNALLQLEEEQRANHQLRRELVDQALRDQSSGLHTRGHFEEQLRRELDLSTREHREFAVVFIEIDETNLDAAARSALIHESIFGAMGRLLRSGTRAMDASCRWDAQRFSVLLSGVGLATAHARMEGLRRQCATQIVAFDGADHRFSVSMGVASFPHTADSGSSLLLSCEAALNDARSRGGNQVTLARILFNPS